MTMWNLLERYSGILNYAEEATKATQTEEGKVTVLLYVHRSEGLIYSQRPLNALWEIVKKALKKYSFTLKVSVIICHSTNLHIIELSSLSIEII